jgi:hypothetical protein
MTKRLVCLGAFLVLVFLSSFGFQDGVDAQTTVQPKSQTPNPAQQRGARRVSRAAIADWARMAKSPTPPPTQIGFLSGIQTSAGGGTFPSFPAVIGDFTGNGLSDVAAIVNTGTTTPTYNIAAALNNGKGGLTTVLTPTGAAEQDPIFVGDLNGDGKDDVLIVHPAASANPTYIEGWISKGDGTFTNMKETAATTNGFVWAAVVDVNGDGKLDVVVADANSPGNIWTLLGNGDGTFQTATGVGFMGGLNPGPPGGVPGNPMVFADFNGDGKLDFAAAAAGTNQIMVYLCNGATNCSSYATPTPLSTPDSVYDSCFLGGGPLKTGGPFGELVSANCLDNNITVYVNNAGTFTAQPYFPVASNPVGVTVADVNGDTNTDIVASCTRSADIKVLLGNGTGAVTPATVGYVTGGSPLVPPLVANFNGSTNPVDVVVPDDEFSFVYLQGYGDGSFRSAVNYYAEPGGGSRAQAVNIASGDFNGDGIPDFVIGNVSSADNASVTVFLSNSDGTLKPGVNYYNSALTTYSLEYVAVADFNGDGKLDIAATDNFNGVVQIFNGNGDGTFTTGATYQTDTASGANPVGLVVGDFNGDSKPDLAVINNHTATTADVGILLNNGSGLNSVVNYPLSTLATEITAAALRGPGKPLDLIVPLYGTSAAPGSAVAILLGNGNGTFGNETDVQLTNTAVKNPYLNPYYAAVGDLNGDGKVDLAVTIEDQTHFNQGIAVVLGNGDGTFQANPVLLASTMQNPAQDVPLPGYVHIADVNQDGIPDLVYSNSEFSTVGILYGQGNGAFYNPVEFPADRWAWGLALVDLYGDGATNVVVSGNSLDFSGVAVLFNSGASKTTLASSANPSNPGAAVTFTATVASPVKGVTAIPTGSVTFNDGSTKLGPGALNSSGMATFTTSTLADGPHSVTAQYAGDVNFLPTVSAALNQTVLVASYALAATTASGVNPGSSATYKITQTAANGYNGTVSYPATACSGLPTGAACSFSPSSVTGSGTTTLTITTTAPTAALVAPPRSTPQKGALDLWASLGGLGLVGVVLAGDWRSRNRRRLGMVLAVLAVMFLITLVGCGGGSSSSGGGGGGGTGGTPPGTSSIQVSVKDAAGTSPSNGPLKVTLTVN